MRLCRAKDVTTYASERIPTHARWHLDADGGGGSWCRFWKREKRSSLVSQPSPPLPLALLRIRWGSIGSAFTTPQYLPPCSYRLTGVFSW